jgi:acyl carrier protein
MTKSDSISASIIAFIKEERNLEVSGNTEIFKDRYVNSMFAMRLLMFVETKYCVQLEDDDLSPQNFRTPDSLAQLVALRI